MNLAKGFDYIIESTADLQVWKPIGQGAAGNDPIEYVDSEASNFSYRFYRVRIGMVQSANVIGYVSVTLPPGFSMIANPLNAPDNSVSELFKDWPDGTTLNKFDVQFFRLADNAMNNKKWSNTAEKLLPTEGGIFFNPTTDYKSHNFVGEVMQGHLSVPIPGGFSVRSSLVPLPGSLDDLGFPIANGDVIHLFDRDRQKYVLHPFEDGKWQAGPPTVSVGEAFWVAKTEPGNWIRNVTFGHTV